MTDESYNAECRTGAHPPATAVTVVKEPTQNRMGRQVKLISPNRFLSSKIPHFQKMWGRKHYSWALREQSCVQGFLAKCLFMLICFNSEELKIYYSITLIHIFFFSGKSPFQYICPHLKAPNWQTLWTQFFEIYFTKFTLKRIIHWKYYSVV